MARATSWPRAFNSRAGDEHVGQRAGAGEGPAFAADHEDFHGDKFNRSERGGRKRLRQKL